MTEEVSASVEAAWRRLRYRLQRQGMLELDAWLAPLLDAHPSAVPEMDCAWMQAVESLLAKEPPELLAMMHGDQEIPASLRRWLEMK